ncbi:MAG TPA: ABC transporter ATP-binding protein, partial [Ktedonobacteraceae bacterium]
MELPLKQYLRLLAKYLKPQLRRSLLMGALLLASIGLQLANPQVLRYFIDTATGRGSVPGLTIAAILFIGIALTNQGIS